MSSQAEIDLAYSGWGERLVAKGWRPYLLTFMFKPLPGSPTAVAHQMEREVERVYATLLTRIVRKPARTPLDRLPVWFCCHDRPVYKHSKISLRDAAVNDGAHTHATAFLPPWSRLREGLGKHFDEHARLYVRPRCPLLRIDCVPVVRRVGYVVGYTRKEVGRSAQGQDASFVLPRAAREVWVRAA